MMRDGYEMDSQKLGVLEVGDTVLVAERRENEANIFRCKFVAPNGGISWCVSQPSATSLHLACLPVYLPACLPASWILAPVRS